MMKMNHLVVLLFALCMVIPLVSATFKAVQYCNKNINHPVKVSGLEDISSYTIARGKTLLLKFQHLQGNYNLKMTMLDGKKKQLTCITFDFTIGFLALENENLASI